MKKNILPFFLGMGGAGLSATFFLHKNISLKNLTQLYDFEAFIKNGMGILFHLKKKLSIKYRIC